MFYRLLFCLCALVFLTQCSETPDQTLKIGVIVSGEDARKSAITHFVNYAIEQQNLKGGIGGKLLKAEIFDDDNQPEILEKQGKEIIADKSFIGVVGGWNSTRASKIIDIFGKNNMPYIGDFSNADLFSQYSNIYTMAPSDNYDFKRAIFIGREGDNYSKKHQDFIKIQSQYPKSKDKTYALCKSLFYEQRSLKPEELSEIVQTAQDCRADLIFLSLGSVYNARHHSNNDV